MHKLYGHKNIVNILENTVAGNKISNAYLFVGDDGIGKRFMAEYFAMMVNCKSKVYKPCFKCGSCIKMSSKNHPDTFVIEPDGNSIKVETIRDFVIKEMNIKPYQSYKKIFIIDDAHKMTAAAQNALLKTLEEPPLYGLFILTAPKREELLPTIVSRCNVVRFTKESVENIKNYLVFEHNIDKEKASVLAVIADGNFKEADKLSNEEYIRLRIELIDIINEIIGSSIFSVLDKYTYFETNKDKIDDIIKMMMLYFRDIFIYKNTGDPAGIKNVDMVEKVKNLSVRLTNFRLNNIINRIEQFNANLKLNVNYQLAVENLLLNIVGGL